MIKLLHEYEKTLAQTRKQLNEKVTIANKYESIKEKLSPSGVEYLRIVRSDIKILNAAIRDIMFTIEWIATGGNPERRRGIERRTIYEKEILFDPLANTKFQATDSYDIDKKDDELMAAYKLDLVNDITRTFTARQKEIFELYAQNHTEIEIGKMLGTSQQYISKTIVRCRQKIKEEGWMMV